ncbi:hypothetical protein D3875_22815 [Deinococcus cavernae]|uniref:Uncharacterized protein n=1 Tax=Deinococcus cavernae TaxID=2320857 RepID=A0A418V089_9DEIO|nr:hypothetical protein [Deinococcus cavernae]RJF69149.1 hypothetical protein D3875_22815 [Deinococcus cavernae]
MTNPTIKPTNVRRTWQLAFVAPLRPDQQVTLQADCHGHQTAWIDGVSADFDTAVRLLQDGLLCGTVTLISDEVPFAGKRAAHQLHRLLGELGFKDHYGLATEALGRPVSSLTHLSAPELVLLDFVDLDQHLLVVQFSFRRPGFPRVVATFRYL